MNVWRIKRNTTAYKDFLQNLTYMDSWTAKEKEILAFLGIKELQLLIPDARCLKLYEVPKQLQEQFSKSREDGKGRLYYYAAKNSKINNAWIEFCKQQKLLEYNPWLWLKYGIDNPGRQGSGESIEVHLFKEDLYLTADGAGSSMGPQNWLEPFSMAEFNRLREVQAGENTD